MVVCRKCFHFQEGNPGRCLIRKGWRARGDEDTERDCEDFSNQYVHDLFRKEEGEVR